MAIALSSLRRNAPTQPPRILVYGPGGIGKSTLAAGAPAPVYLQTEDADLAAIERALGCELPHSPVLQSYAEVIEWIDALGTEDHEFLSVILDSTDHLEPMIWAEACARNGWDDLEQVGYGKGYLAADVVWRELFARFDALRDYKGMAVIFIAHADIKNFKSPEVEPFDRYVIKLHTRAAALLQEHADAVLFANWRVSVVKDGADKKGKGGHARGVGGGTRMLYTQERPAYLAKNRWSMPEQITLPDNAAGAWAELAKHIPFYANAKE